MAAVALVIFAGAAITGSFLSWVSVAVHPSIVPGANFGGRVPSPTNDRGRRFSGVEAKDGWYVIGSAAVIAAAAIVFGISRRRGFAILAFAGSIVIAAIGVSDYRGVSDISSTIARRMDIVGVARPGVGLILVTACGFGAILASALALVSAPRAIP